MLVLLRKLRNVSISLTVGAILAEFLIPAVLEERGYFAVGGEWMLIIATVVGVYLLIRDKEREKWSGV